MTEMIASARNGTVVNAPMTTVSDPMRALARRTQTHRKTVRRLIQGVVNSQHLQLKVANVNHRQALAAMTADPVHRTTRLEIRTRCTRTSLAARPIMFHMLSHRSPLQGHYTLSPLPLHPM